MTANLVFANVYLGGMEDCPSWPGSRINTMLPHQLCRVPVCFPMKALEEDVGNGASDVRFPLANLRAIALKIEERAGTIPLLVHCAQGVERSPLAVAYWLHRYRGFTFDDAYTLVRRQRPQAQDRRHWIAP